MNHHSQETRAVLHRFYEYLESSGRRASTCVAYHDAVSTALRHFKSDNIDAFQAYLKEMQERSPRYSVRLMSAWSAFHQFGNASNEVKVCWPGRPGATKAVKKALLDLFESTQLAPRRIANARWQDFMEKEKHLRIFMAGNYPTYIQLDDKAVRALYVIRHWGFPDTPPSDASPLVPVEPKSTRPMSASTIRGSIEAMQIELGRGVVGTSKKAKMALQGPTTSVPAATDSSSQAAVLQPAEQHQKRNMAINLDRDAPNNSGITIDESGRFVYTPTLPDEDQESSSNTPPAGASSTNEDDSAVTELFTVPDELPNN